MGRLAFLLLGAVVVVACGSSDNAGPAKHDGGGGSAAAGGSAGSGGGIAGQAGTGGSAGQGSDASAGAAGAGAVEGGAGSGPTCASFPAQVDFQTSGSCTAPSTCGGTLDGTTWNLDSMCAADLFAKVYNVCSSAAISVTSSSASGAVAFKQGVMNASVHAKASATLTLPDNCAFCQCTAVESDLIAAGFPTASCSPVCSSGNCTCYVDAGVDLEESVPYTTSSGVITAGQGLFDYCIDQSTLTLSDAAGSPQFSSAAFTAGPPPQEVCDGLDNDVDGVVDDNPQDCPTCSNVGVCAAGFNATCQGSSGWSCTYTSPAYEQTEQSCDGLDNDCNGKVDESIKCEICDGIDNDGDGVVDDHLVDKPNCTKTGVCASGTTGVCKGTDGWLCQGTASTFQAVETTCDGLDNDCDGAIDEACPVCTSRKDLWVIANGGTNTTIKILHGAPTDTTGQVVLTAPGSQSSKLAVDPVGGKLYWEDNAALERANLDGSGIESLAATNATAALVGLGVDPGKTLYWCEAQKGILRAPVGSLTTSGAATMTVAGASSSTIVVAAGQLYYNESGSSGGIWRANLDGSGAKQLVSFPVDDFVVDLIGNHVYFMHFFDFSSITISRVNLDGTALQTVSSIGSWTDDFYFAGFDYDAWADQLYIAGSDLIQYRKIGAFGPPQLMNWTSNQLDIQLVGCTPK